MATIHDSPKMTEGETMTGGEIVKWLNDYSNQFYDNPTISLKHFKDGYKPDGMEKLAFSMSVEFTRGLPDAPMQDKAAKKKWAFYMALQLILHQKVGSNYGTFQQSFDIAAWRLQTGRFEELLGQNKMKPIDEKIMAEVDLNTILKINVKKRLNGETKPFHGMGFLSDPSTVMLTGHQLSSRKGGDAVKLEAIARDGTICVADTVAVTLYWLLNQGKNSSSMHDFGMANLKESLHHLPSLNCKKTPDTSGHPGGMLPGAVFGHPDRFPDLCYASMDIKFHHGGPISMIHHNGDTVKGNSGSPVTVGRNAVGIHSCWEWLDKGKTEMINGATPINHHGNDMNVFRHILDYMAVMPTLYEELKDGLGGPAKFLAIRDGGIAEVEVVGYIKGETRAVHFRWREVEC
ncbi:hypothetical protein F4680DRAFT_405838 [Xylaria scruposa]|nr:hypothetical protein F4680DRAFT_405838 [Xylaria scruposa]